MIISTETDPKILCCSLNQAKSNRLLAGRSRLPELPFQMDETQRHSTFNKTVVLLITTTYQKPGKAE
jgi:hypothetical protein